MKKKIALLGSTGSIGTSALEIAKHIPEEIEVVALAAHSNIVLLEQQIQQFRPEIVAVYDEKKAQELKARGLPVRIVSGREGIEEVASFDTVDFVLVAIVGMAALHPTLRAIEAGKTIGLASKEILVSAGEWICSFAREKGVALLPIDSEHSALFQCLQGESMEQVRRLILTASGGPFRTFSKEALSAATIEQALDHPTWQMGKKVTIDSSNLMNKGFEMIEARWLFDLPAEQIEIVIHPQSVVHSLVDFVDGTMLAELHQPDMKVPIQYALTYPRRLPGTLPPFDFTKSQSLEFFPPDPIKFPALDLAYESVRVGKSLPCYLNAANEVLVLERFLEGTLSWEGIVQKLERLLSKHTPCPCSSIEAVLSIDELAREEARAV